MVKYNQVNNKPLHDVAEIEVNFGKQIHPNHLQLLLSLAFALLCFGKTGVRLTSDCFTQPKRTKCRCPPKYCRVHRFMKEAWPGEMLIPSKLLLNPSSRPNLLLASFHDDPLGKLIGFVLNE